MPIGIAVATLIGGTSIAAAASSSSSKASPIVKEAKSAKLGAILVSSTGLTLYRFIPDTTSKVACTGSCATTWPPLVLPSGQTSPVGANGLSGLGTIKDPNGKLQVTYKGHPLYRFVGDKKAGATNGQKIEGTWFVVTPSIAKLAAVATAVKSSAPSQTSSSTSSSTGSSTSGQSTSSPAPATTNPTPTPTTAAPVSSGGYGY